MSYEEDTSTTEASVSYEEEDTCVSYEEDTSVVEVAYNVP